MAARHCKQYIEVEKMIDLFFVYKSFLVAAQVVLNLTSVITLVCNRKPYSQHNYKAGLFSTLWAGATLSYTAHTIVNWHIAISNAWWLPILASAISAGLAVYSGGNIYKVGRLCRRLCGGR